GLARAERLLGAADAHAPFSLEDDVDLVLIAVRMRLLGLTRRDAIQVEERTLGGAERDLRHLVRLEADVVANRDLLHLDNGNRNRCSRFPPSLREIRRCSRFPPSLRELRRRSRFPPSLREIRRCSRFPRSLRELIL